MILRFTLMNIIGARFNTRPTSLQIFAHRTLFYLLHRNRTLITSCTTSIVGVDYCDTPLSSGLLSFFKGFNLEGNDNIDPAMTFSRVPGVKQARVPKLADYTRQRAVRKAETDQLKKRRVDGKVSYLDLQNS